MEISTNPLFIAIITSIAGPIIVLIVKHIIDQRQYPNSSIERKKRLLGDWKGSFEQIDPNDSSKTLKADITICLKKNGRIIKGNANFISPFQEGITTVKIKNGKFDGDVLKVDYENEKKYIFQKGTIIAKMDNKGNQLIGDFVGFSPAIDAVISGQIKVFRNN